jgi:hypothetical protein
MRKKTLFAVVTVSLCAIVAAGGLLASNMGFKLNYRLTTTAAGGGAGTGKNTLALPYFRQTGLNNALELMGDIGNTSGTPSIIPVASVSRFLEATDTLATYTGRMGSPTGTPFALTAGEGYNVSMYSNVNYIVVGSHDPSLIISMDGPGAGSASGKNFLATPYNITSTNSLQLMNDIGGVIIIPVASVSRFITSTDSLATYTGRMGSPTGTPFLLTPGEAYKVSMYTTVAYTPSHY